MNPKFREFAEQAGWMMGDEVEGFNTRLEKFAELIVRACAEQARTHNLQHAQRSYMVHQTLLDNFGVTSEKSTNLL